MVIAGILKDKGNSTISVTPRASIADVIQTLASKRIGAVLVMEGGTLHGILSERDVVRCLAHDGAAALDRPAADLMTANVQTATPQTTVDAALELMTQGRFRHIPVMDEGRLAGLVSIGDVVKAKIDGAEHEVDTLRAYVAGAA